MNVSDILDQAIELGVGFDNVDTNERALYLKYLNMAGEKLYAVTAPLDEQRSSTYIQLNFDETAEISLVDLDGNPVNVLAAGKVRNKNIDNFTHITYAKMKENKFIGDNESPVFCFRDNVFTLYSNEIKPYDAFIAYTPSFTALSENTQEKDIPFRREWHPLLVYGTLYYIYQDIDGFKSSVKESVAASEWKSGIASYSASLFNSSPDGYIPYTRV